MARAQGVQTRRSLVALRAHRRNTLVLVEFAAGCEALDEARLPGVGGADDDAVQSGSRPSPGRARWGYAAGRGGAHLTADMA